jgi:hypothetical protein
MWCECNINDPQEVQEVSLTALLARNSSWFGALLVRNRSNVQKPQQCTDAAAMYRCCLCLQLNIIALMARNRSYLQMLLVLAAVTDALCQQHPSSRCLLHALAGDWVHVECCAHVYEAVLTV